MKNRIFLHEDRRKYQGNLHMHSNRSDGQFEPETVISAYRQKGYDFICLSDHEIYYRSNAYDDEHFLVLDGYEMACNMSRSRTGQQYHLHGLLDPSLPDDALFSHDEEHPKPEYESLDTIQQLINEMQRRGNLVILNHPEWSRNRMEDLLRLQGYVAVEIYNHQSELDEAAGNSVAYWDYLLRNGRKVFAISADDSHRGPIEAAVSEYFGGWIGVEADTLTQAGIIDALKTGRYYSSNGPSIKDLRLVDGEIRITSSPVQFIKFITHPNVGNSCYNRDGSPIEEGVYRLNGREQVIRVECVDFSGRTAWSNPIFLDECTQAAKETP